MKSHSWTRPIWLALILLTGLSSVGSVAAMPAGKFACQVIVTKGRIGLVMVQADNRQLAARAAVGAEAFTTDNMRGPATEVLECIRRGEERFSDYQFQQFYEGVPR